MPKLHGKPFKKKLYADVRHLKAELSGKGRLESENYVLKVRLGGEIERREKVEQELQDLKTRLLELAE